MRRVVLWASQCTEVLALIKTTTDLNVRDFRWTVAHSQKTGGMEVARLEYARYGRHHFFQFDRHQGQHYAIYTAGNDGNVEEHFPDLGAPGALLCRLGRPRRCRGAGGSSPAVAVARQPPIVRTSRTEALNDPSTDARYSACGAHGRR